MGDRRCVHPRVVAALVVGPSSPWRRLAAGETPGAVPPEYEGVEWLWPFVEVTSAARHVTGLLAVLDDLEIWQIAAALGVHDPPADGPAKLRSGGAESAVARRMRAAQAGLPEPEPDTPDPAVMAWAAQFNVRP